MKNIETTARDGHTRGAIVSLLMAEGPLTATVISAKLGISATAVRRHLDNLVDLGQAQTATPSRVLDKRRGRPSKGFLLTPKGRRGLRQEYDTLAIDALRALRSVGGDDAVREFARRRVETAVGFVPPASTDSPDKVRDTADAIAVALTTAGFSADTRTVGDAGIQICQHHCPVSEVAAEFPELCEAEIAVFSQALGTHVQRLATIANGDRACTTHVPLKEQV